MLSILKEIFIFLAFLFFLNWVTFSNLSQSSYQYNQLFIATFVKQQSQNEIVLENVRKNILKIARYNDLFVMTIKINKILTFFTTVNLSFLAENMTVP